jgi:uncharacterized membrane protein YdjX (TVP38/TMEM64 family)
VAAGQSGQHHGRPPPPRALLLALALLAAIGAAALAWIGPDRLAALPEGLCRGALGGFALVVGLMILHALLPVPAELVALAAGACLGLGAGIASVWLGAMAGAMFSFELARWLGRPFLERWLAPATLGRLDALALQGGAPGLLGIRLIPLIAFNLVNYGAGLTPVPRRTFLWTTALGILPVTILSVWLGATMRELSSGWIALLCAAGLAILAAGWWLRRR